jgi:type II secretory pathway pseudopilin PulG
MKWHCRRNGSGTPFAVDEGGWLTLIGLLITVIIIAILAVYILQGPGAFGPNSSSKAGGLAAAKESATAVACKTNLQQIRSALQMAQMEGGGNPASLEDLAQANPNLQLNCPVGGEEYQYDPGSARVWCAHPGHEGF